VELRGGTGSHGESQGVAEGSGCLRHHPVTGQLSSLLLTILGWRRPGKIGSANTKPLRRKSRGFCRAWRTARSCGEVQGIAERHGGVAGGHTWRTVVLWTIAGRSMEESTENNDV
jgi:hypothetical protein